jgi:methylenetetrahydrofolate dehydrogenase (NADP+)/methenyltetrahydrofolate cyclohydrolase
MILDGKKLSDEIAEILKKQIEQSEIVPTLAIIQVGEVEESNAYIRHKKNFGEKIGAKVLHLTLPLDIKEEELISKIQELNNTKDVHGIIVQLPIPEHLDKRKIIESVDPQKDVDGLHSINQSKIFQGDTTGLTPATPRGIMTLLNHYGIELEEKKVLVVGRSLLVGRPVAMLLLKANATVTIAHSKSKDLSQLVREHDIVVVAVGKAGLITKNMVSEGQVIVDVGTNSVVGPKTLEEIETRKLVGDVVFEEVKDIVYAISPVPGGVGPMTVASLFENLVKVTLQK